MTSNISVITDLQLGDETTPVKVPDLWGKYFWHRPFMEMEEASRESAETRIPPKHHFECDNLLVTGYDFARMMQRRSAVKWADYEMQPETFRSFLQQVYALHDASSSLFCGMRTQNVVGWADGWWMVSKSPNHLRYLGDEDEMASSLVQGQHWADGDGLAIFLGVDWEYHRIQYPHQVSSYFQELVNMGRFAQTLVSLATSLGLSSRMTPAISESRASEILALPEERDVIHHVRIGRQFVNPNE